MVNVFFYLVCFSGKNAVPPAYKWWNAIPNLVRVGIITIVGRSENFLTQSLAHAETSSFIIDDVLINI